MADGLSASPISSLFYPSFYGSRTGKRCGLAG